MSSDQVQLYPQLENENIFLKPMYEVLHYKEEGSGQFQGGVHQHQHLHRHHQEVCLMTSSLILIIVLSMSINMNNR